MSSTKTIGYQRLWFMVLMRAWGLKGKIMHILKSWLMDVEYKVIPYDELVELVYEFIHWLHEKNLHYIKEYFDCDDFATAFKSFMAVNGYNVGVAIGELHHHEYGFLGYHAWNIAVTDYMGQEKLVFIEPQTGDIFFTNISRIDKFIYRLLVVIW